MILTLISSLSVMIGHVTRTRTSLLTGCLIALPLLCVLLGQTLTHRADPPSVPQEPVVVTTDRPAAVADDEDTTDEADDTEDRPDPGDDHEDRDDEDGPADD